MTRWVQHLPLLRAAPVMDCARRNACFALLQIDINVEREVLNHKQLVHPNVVQFKEVRMYA